MNIKLQCISLLSLNLKDLIYFKNNFNTEFNIINEEIWNNIIFYSINMRKTIYFNYNNNKIPMLSYNKLIKILL
jgi:hypothetical protein